MYRTHNCGQLRIENINEQVTLCGWVQRIRDKGGMIWSDLRDRYGITQLVFEEGVSSDQIIKTVNKLGREFVIQVRGQVIERIAKNPNLPTGDVEIQVDNIEILNPSKLPPFTIEDNTDGGEEIRMKYRYLDIRRNEVKNNILLRHKLSVAVRNYMNSLDFIEVETPVLIKSTPEGARDFIVPSRINEGQFYALPQSPQTFKQLLMVGGLDKYFQIVKCFRDEDLRADRQPEFTQIDCEMSFTTREEIFRTFEGLAKHIFREMKGVDLGEFKCMPYDDAINYYGTDKPDTRFDMKFVNISDEVKGKGFNVFDNAGITVGINAKGCAGYSRKQLDKLTDFVRKPQIGAKGLVYVKYNEDGSIKSSVDKFYDNNELRKWIEKFGAEEGDLLLILAGDKKSTLTALGELRLEMGQQLGLRDNNKFSPLWVIDFPLLEWDEDEKRYFAVHHPFTSPVEDDIKLLDTDPAKVRANAYDMVINGVELGGGSIRIHDKGLQEKMFKALGFTDEEAKAQFGFLMNAFEYGAPPHGGIAFGFDRWCALLGGTESIRDYIAFPKNNAGRDIMIDAPSDVDSKQLSELGLKRKS